VSAGTRTATGGGAPDRIPPDAHPRLPPNLPDPDDERARFSWDAARAALDGLPSGGLNIAHEAADRHAAGERAGRVALRCIAADGRVTELTYAELAARSSRFANALGGLGVRPGSRLFVLAPRVPDLYVAVLGALKARVVVSPLFPAFGPEPIRQRIEIGAGSVLVTSDALHARKVAPIRDELASLRHVVLIGDGPAVEGTVRMADLLAGASDEYRIGPTPPETPALLHFTSGTTGTPKGALHVHEAVVAHRASARYALDLHDEDVFWCTADPGWVTGTSYGIVAPLTLGVTSVVDEAEFSAERWYGILAEHDVSVWYTAPTAIRMMMRSGAAPSADAARALRFIASVGEPLDPEAVRWGLEAFGRPIHDNWWQTETGAIMIANTAGSEIRPGSMGRPLPGVDARVVALDEDREPVLRDGEPVPCAPGQEGEIALRVGWPSMFRGYLGRPERYEASFRGDWYLSGDLARRDADGWFWFVGRKDDVIKSAGHLVGPFEVEATLAAHPDVAEAAVVGLPDPTLGEAITAFVVPRAGREADVALERDVRAFARRRLGAAIAPRTVRFAESLPHTRSGKIMRRLLRARELGLPEGDLSTLEGGR
jgi:acetyl-CoA synthetase